MRTNFFRSKGPRVNLLALKGHLIKLSKSPSPLPQHHPNYRWSHGGYGPKRYMPCPLFSYETPLLKYLYLGYQDNVLLFDTLVTAVNRKRMKQFADDWIRTQVHSGLEELLCRQQQHCAATTVQFW